MHFSNIHPLSVICVGELTDWFKVNTVCGCLATATFTTLLDLASPIEYGHMSMLFINEYSNKVLNGDQREAEYGLR